MKKAFVTKSVGADWPRWAAVIPDSTKTSWHSTEHEAQEIVDAFNRVPRLLETLERVMRDYETVHAQWMKTSFFDPEAKAKIDEALKMARNDFEIARETWDRANRERRCICELAGVQTVKPSGF